MILPASNNDLTCINWKICELKKKAENVEKVNEKVQNNQNEGIKLPEKEQKTIKGEQVSVQVAVRAEVCFTDLECEREVCKGHIAKNCYIHTVFQKDLGRRSVLSCLLLTSASICF